MFVITSVSGSGINTTSVATGSSKYLTKLVLAFSYHAELFSAVMLTV